MPKALQLEQGRIRRADPFHLRQLCHLLAGRSRGPARHQQSLVSGSFKCGRAQAIEWTRVHFQLCATRNVARPLGMFYVWLEAHLPEGLRSMNWHPRMFSEDPEARFAISTQGQARGDSLRSSGGRRTMSMLLVSVQRPGAAKSVQIGCSVRSKNRLPVLESIRSVTQGPVGSSCAAACGLGAGPRHGCPSSTWRLGRTWELR